jgi:hypothetical protein
LIISGGPLSGPTVVGGEVFHINKLQVIMPWLIIAAIMALLSIGGAGYMVKKRRTVK